LVDLQINYNDKKSNHNHNLDDMKMLTIERVHSMNNL